MVVLVVVVQVVVMRRDAVARDAPAFIAQPVHVRVDRFAADAVDLFDPRTLSERDAPAKPVVDGRLGLAQRGGQDSHGAGLFLEFGNGVHGPTYTPCFGVVQHRETDS